MFKGKHLYRYPVPLDGELPVDIFVVCEWYSPIERSNRLRFRFRQLSDRTKYSMLHFIGLVRIDLEDESSSSSSSSSRSDNEETYCISPDQRSTLDEALKMTTPVQKGSNTTNGERKRKQERKVAEQKEDEERTQRPRLAALSRAGERGGTRAASAAATSTTAAGDDEGDGVAEGGGGDVEMTD